MAVIRQQQALLQQAVGNRVQSILTPEQATMLQGVFSQLGMSPNRLGDLFITLLRGGRLKV